MIPGETGGEGDNGGAPAAVEATLVRDEAGTATVTAWLYAASSASNVEGEERIASGNWVAYARDHAAMMEQFWGEVQAGSRTILSATADKAPN